VNNPILTPADVKPFREDFEVIGTFNAGVAMYDGETILLSRVAERPKVTDATIVRIPFYDHEAARLAIHNFDTRQSEFDFSDPRGISSKSGKHTAYLTSLSYLRIARSRDGIHFTVDEKAFMFPENEYEAFGLEDPRITQIGDEYYITYTSVSSLGVGVGLAMTTDFKRVQRLGLIFPPENKDVVIFPEVIEGKYYALHRPSVSGLGNPEIWVASSTDLVHWGGHRHLMGIRPDSWDSVRLGAGAVPIKTEDGWLEIYHGSDEEGRYTLGAVLLDLKDPTKIIARSDRPILEPEADYEVNGFYKNVVFSCGLIAEGDRLRIYYGVADTAMAGVELDLQDVMDSLNLQRV
jgi:predicted GH43/DUF377 family glycosyl hydrolase